MTLRYDQPAEASSRVRCSRCGDEFDPAINTPASCSYHPGQLWDYDRYKMRSEHVSGDFWDCCMKQLGVDDDSGCTKGPHVGATIP